MEPKYAEEKVIKDEDKLFYVRLPLHIKTAQQLLLHLVLQDKELFNIEELSNEFIDEITKLVYLNKENINDGHEFDTTLH
jgi:hypothetical protein